MKAPRLSTELCFALYSASNTITSIYRPLLVELNLTYPQLVVLMCLWEQDNIPIKLITEHTLLNKATMTPLLKRLEEKGMIRREIMKENERQKNISLTISGKKLASKARRVTETVFCETGLSAEEARTMMGLCHKITQTKHLGLP